MLAAQGIHSLGVFRTEGSHQAFIHQVLVEGVQNCLFQVFTLDCEAIATSAFALRCGTGQARLVVHRETPAAAAAFDEVRQ
ncbi:hypothetical protein [Phaeobacter inhibens]|uniref:hypothetical protein n=1 Tax=Phaeobacter inhibens TaxID=221822 RepID=UPI0020C7AE67|nr:hypothetical protein [Phaeobacter inhibens]